MIKEIATFILDQLSHPYWSRDINYFVGHLPIKNKEGTDVNTIPRIAVILENTPAGVVPDLPDRADKPVQIWNRNASFFTAREDAYDFYEMLHGSSQWQLPQITSGKEYTAMIIDALATPAPIENPDTKGRYVFSANYLFRVAE